MCYVTFCKVVLFYVLVSLLRSCSIWLLFDYWIINGTEINMFCFHTFSFKIKKFQILILYRIFSLLCFIFMWRVHFYCAFFFQIHFIIHCCVQINCYSCTLKQLRIYLHFDICKHIIPKIYDFRVILLYGEPTFVILYSKMFLFYDKIISNVWSLWCYPAEEHFIIWSILITYT